ELILGAADFDEARADFRHLLRAQGLFRLRVSLGGVGRGARGERGTSLAAVHAKLAREFAHGAREGDAVHQFVEGYRVAALSAREAVEESLLQVNRKTRVALARVRVRGDGAEAVQARARSARVGAVARVERAVVNNALHLVAQFAQVFGRGALGPHALEVNKRREKMEGWRSMCGPPSP